MREVQVCETSEERTVVHHGITNAMKEVRACQSSAQRASWRLCPVDMMREIRACQPSVQRAVSCGHDEGAVAEATETSCIGC